MKDFSLKINGQTYLVQIDDTKGSPSEAHVVVNGVDYEVEIDGIGTSASSKPHVAPAPQGANNAIIVPGTAAAAAAAAPRTAAPSGAGYSVRCPLPGTVLAIRVAAGDRIAPGQTLVVLEAMKMENNIDADRGGVVKQVLVQQGATVMEGDVLIVIE